MAKVTFRAKPEILYNMDNSEAYRRIKVPVLSRAHCDMAAFRSHPRFGAYANSDLFPNLLRRQRELLGVREYIRLDQPLPPNVTVDVSGFLAVVTIDMGT